ncbi:MAG: recombinase family protein [Methanomassiliicoccales archaeon]|nr:MAG: recombinase family protein [Methanomassiliicoccales archaeon]
MDGDLRINSEESEGVLLIFQLYIEGMSTGDIAYELEKRGYATKKNGSWSARTVGKILKNPVYCGYLEWEKEVYPGTHEKIISVEDFNIIQKLIYKNTRNKKLRRKPRLLPEPKKEIHEVISEEESGGVPQEEEVTQDGEAAKAGT